MPCLNISYLRSVRRRILMLGLLALASAFAPAAAIAASGPYLLGPQDELEIRVYDLRPGSGDVHQWSAFDGNFVIDASGSLSLPVVGETPVSNMTTTDLASLIATRLQTKIGLAQAPYASVQVIKYRPFYIMGAVEKPGAYEYRPELTVLQAISIAGGLIRPVDGELMSYERDALASVGDFRVQEADRLSLLIRQARLDAEISGADSITLPPEVKAKAGSPAVAKAISEEQLLLDSKRKTLQSQIDAIEQTKTLVSQELTTLTSKDASLSQQLNLSRKELTQVNGLVSRGLAVVPQQLASEQNAASFESDKLDVQLATLRAQQNLTAADRDILDLAGKSREDALTDAAVVRTDLAEVEQKMNTDRSLIYQAEVQAPQTVGADNITVRPSYLLTRDVQGGAQTKIASEETLVEPGDVLQVQMPKSADLSSDDLTSSALATGRTAAVASKLQTAP
jgi:polysaccharide biosynthesis/export protein ExoF